MKVIRSFSSLLIVLMLLVTAMLAFGYPLDGYEETGIRRVEGARLANEGLAIGGFQPAGAMLTTQQVDLRLLNQDMALPPADPAFTSQITALLGEHAGDYGVTVLDLTDLENPRYAEHRGDYRQNVGSVGKLLVALGYFQALADTWPDDLDRRKAILRDTIMTADDFSHSDHHTGLGSTIWQDPIRSRARSSWRVVCLHPAMSRSVVSVSVMAASSRALMGRSVQ